MRSRLSHLPILLLALVLTAHARTLASPDAERKIWDGVYSPAQADRAKTAFTAVCRRCHNDDLGGSDRGPSLRGERFMGNWGTQDLKLLFAKIRDTMPPDSPSSLPENDYIDLVTLILKTNGFPAGTEDLTPKNVEGIVFATKPGDAPQAVSSFRLVEVVGCLTNGPDDAWTLTNTSEPVLTNDQPPTASALKDAANRPLGSQTFRLISANAFNPRSHAGQKVQANGLLYRAPGKDRINLIALDVVGPNCGA